jgi:transcriptional regulator with XRE-family HTH domain
VEMGKHIMVLRQGKGLTREQLAKEAGISAGYLQRIELGYIFPHIKTIARLAEILGVEVENILMNGEEDNS